MRNIISNEMDAGREGTKPIISKELEEALRN